MFAAAFLIGALYIPGLVSGAVQPRWWVLYITAPFMLAALARRGRTIQMSPGHWCVVLFLVYAMATLALHNNRSIYDGIEEMVNLGALAWWFFVGAEIDRQDMAAFWRGLGCACIVNALFVIVQVAGLPLFNPLGSAPGLFLNRDSLAEFAVLCFFGLVLSKQSPYLISAALLCAVLPGSHSAYLALGVVCVYLLWASGQRKEALGCVAIMCTIGVTLTAVEWHFSPTRLISMQNRLDFWAIGLENLKLLGWGVGFYKWFFPWKYAHNEFLQYAFDYGVGATLLIPVIGYATYFNWKSQQRGLLAERCCLLAFAIMCLVGFPAHEPSPAFVASVVLGRLCGVRYRLERFGLIRGDGHFSDHVHGRLDAAAANLQRAR